MLQFKPEFSYHIGDFSVNRDCIFVEFEEARKVVVPSHEQS